MYENRSTSVTFAEQDRHGFRWNSCVKTIVLRAVVASSFVLLPAEACHTADTVEFLNGSKAQGKVVEIRKADRKFIFEITIAGKPFKRVYPYSKVHAVTMHGKRYVLNPKSALPAGDPDQLGSRVARRTKAEVYRIINEAGQTPPDWYQSVPLSYPKTLDLAWPKYNGPWDFNKDVGQYMWSLVNENPGRWREGTKFMHYLLSTYKDNPSNQRKVYNQLGHCYHDLHGDWARAAFWLRKLKRYNSHNLLQLADCYWKLGNREMAADLLRRITKDKTRYGSVIKIWSDLGDLDSALRLAESSAKAGYRSGAYIGAGDACRKHGQFSQAVAYYRKVIAIPDRPKGAILKRNKQRAQASIDNIEMFETLDLNRIPDGTYSGTSLSYIGDLTVDVSVEANRITDVRVVKHKDKQYFSALTDTPSQIIKKQTLRGIDTTATATITSEAIIMATAKALAKASKGVGNIGTGK